MSVQGAHPASMMEWNTGEIPCRRIENPSSWFCNEDLERLNFASPVLKATPVPASEGTRPTGLDSQLPGSRGMRSRPAMTKLLEPVLILAAHRWRSNAAASRYDCCSRTQLALKFDTGTIAWRDRSVGKGSLAFADNRLYLYSEEGVVCLADASPVAYREHGRFTLSQQSGLPTWSHPILAGGLLVIRDQEAVYAYNVRAK